GSPPGATGRAQGDAALPAAPPNALPLNALGMIAAGFDSRRVRDVDGGAVAARLAVAADRDADLVALRRSLQRRIEAEAAVAAAAADALREDTGRVVGGREDPSTVGDLAVVRIAPLP